MNTVNLSATGIVIAIVIAGFLAAPPCSLARLTDTKFVRNCFTTVVCDIGTMTCQKFE